MSNNEVLHMISDFKLWTVRLVPFYKQSKVLQTIYNSSIICKTNAHLLYGEKSETAFLLFLCGFLWDCSQEEYVCSWEKCVLSEKNRMRTVEEQYCDGRMWSGFDWNNHLLITYWLPTDHLLITYKNTEKICTDHTDYTDADERRELYGSHGKTRMQMNRDSVTLRENPCSSKNIRSIH